MRYSVSQSVRHQTVTNVLLILVFQFRSVLMHLTKTSHVHAALDSLSQKLAVQRFNSRYSVACCCKSNGYCTVLKHMGLSIGWHSTLVSRGSTSEYGHCYSLSLKSLVIFAFPLNKIPGLKLYLDISYEESSHSISQH